MTLVKIHLGPTDEKHVVASSSLQTSNPNEESSSSIIEQISKKIGLDKQVLALDLISYSLSIQNTSTMSTAVNPSSVVRDYLALPDKKLKCLQ